MQAAQLHAAHAAETSQAVLLPHMGMGDMLVLRGMVAALCDRLDRLVVLGAKRYRGSLETLFEDLAPKVALCLVDEAHVVSPAYGADGSVLAAFRRQGYSVIALGYHSGSADWKRLDASWKHALYKQVGLDPGLMHSGFALPASRREQARRMLEAVRRIAGDEPYVLVHDDPSRPLVLPPLPAGHRALHVDDPRFASDNLFDYVEVLRHAAHIHAIESCVALLVDLAGIRTPLTVHLYAKPDPDVHVRYGRDDVEIVRSPPLSNLTPP